MKKYLLAASKGVSIGIIFSLIFSFACADGNYMPVNPFSTFGAYYTSHFSTALTMLIAFCIWAFIGMFFQVTATVFEQDWSLFKMTVVHFLITFVGLFICSIFAGWYPISVGFIFSFFIEFVLIYAVAYAVNYWQMKRNISQINQSLEK